jgi:serine/threonine-protein kinase
MDDAEALLVPGFKLDRYELLCPIASGGMATVWVARLRGKRGFEKLVAIKMIKTELTSDPRFQEMFLDEARIASAIEHPNVAQITDLGEQDGLLYTVMEWVDGESLAKTYRVALKAGSPIPLGIALRIVADACAGIHAAHELCDADDVRLGIVHRDVSPQNILVTSGGAVKVIDFGVAKAMNRRGGVQTQSGTVKGKIRYMAPEQVSGRGVDHHVDIWAMGMCLYEIVTGKPPYDDLEDVDVLKRLMTDDPAPSFAGLPDELTPVFAKTLAKEPSKRFASAAAMRRGIEATLDRLGLSVTTDDVADFIRDVMPELAKRRRATVTKAVDAAKARLGGRETGDPESRAKVRIGGGAAPDEVALAATVVSSPKPKAKDSADEDEAGAAAATATSSTRSLGEDARSTPGATLTDQVGARRTSVFPWLFAILVVGGAGGSVWYANQRGLIHLDGGPSAGEDPAAASGAPSGAPSSSAASDDGDAASTDAAAVDEAGASAEQEAGAEGAPSSASSGAAPTSGSPGASAGEQGTAGGGSAGAPSGGSSAATPAPTSTTKHLRWPRATPPPLPPAHDEVPDAAPRKKWNPMGDDPPVETAEPTIDMR